MKYLILSLLAHLLIISFTFISAKQSSETEQKQQQAEQKEGNSKKKGVDIVEVTLSGLNATEEEPKNYYWGIGVYSEEVVAVTPDGFRAALKITIVVDGYCAKENDIRPGDLIYKVNGKYYPELDVRGNEPGVLYLTIFRENGIILKQFERCKIYY